MGILFIPSILLRRTKHLPTNSTSQTKTEPLEASRPTEDWPYTSSTNT